MISVMVKKLIKNIVTAISEQTSLNESFMN